MGKVFAFFLLVVTIWVTAIVGWFSNLFWLIGFSGDTTTEFWVGLVGTLAVPLGVFHGLYVLF